ncbi:MAG: hypothetical protein AAB691_04255 [Patescibacteria group bacterium]
MLKIIVGLFLAAACGVVFGMSRQESGLNYTFLTAGVMLGIVTFFFGLAWDRENPIQTGESKKVVANDGSDIS